MSSPDYDVFVSFSKPAGEALAGAIAAGLRRRGFRVRAHESGQLPADPRSLALIAQIPDFVVVLPPETLERMAHDEDDPLRAEVAEAIRTRRNIVHVMPPGELTPAAGRALGDLFALRQSHGVTFEPSREGESVAIIAHRLSSDGTVDERRLFHRSKILFWIAGIILLVGISLQEVPRLLERWSQPRLLAPVPPFALYWAGVGQRLDGGKLVDFALVPDTPVAKGERIRVVFSPSADGYAYAVWRNPQGEVDVLFPTGTVRGASRVEAGKVYFAPVDTGWLTIEDQAGEASLYLVAGYDPQHNLEELVDPPEGSASPAARRQLLDSTIGGLLDGRHGATERRVWTGKLHPIDMAMKPAAGPSSAPVTLADGRTVTAALAAQPGLVSTSVEIKLHCQ